MTVREIARAAAVLLQADDISAALGTAAAAGNEDVRTLVSCVNLAAAELCADGFPLCYTEELSATNGVIPFSVLSHTPSRIVSVKRGGAAVPFAVDTQGVKVGSGGKHAVTYYAVPNERSLDQTVEVGALCDANVLAYYAARNYCLVTGRTDEASIWDQRGNAEAEKHRLARRAKLKRREWS